MSGLLFLVSGFVFLVSGLVFWCLDLFWGVWICFWVSGHFLSGPRARGGPARADPGPGAPGVGALCQVRIKHNVLLLNGINVVFPNKNNNVFFLSKKHALF